METDERVQQDQQSYTCVHAGGEVQIKSTVVYPARPFGSIPPRLVRRECDHLVDCHLLDKSACPMGVMSI